MSLGFNQFRPPRTANLPGIAGGNFAAPRRRRPTARSPVVETPSGPRLVKPDLPEPPAKPLPARLERTEASAAKAHAGGHGEDHHWVWATAEVDVVAAADASRVLARKGERVLLVYPMRSLDAAGRVGMGMKTCNPTTGQLGVEEAVVFDPEADVPRCVSNFSLLP
jgi:hypothetical protein